MGRYCFRLRLVLTCSIIAPVCGLAGADYRLSVQEIQALAEKQSLALKAQELENRIAAAAIKTARLWDNPELELQYDYHAITPTVANNPATVDARISQPLQLFGLRDARVQEARARVAQTYLQTADFRRIFLLQVRLSAFKVLVLQKALDFQRAFYDNYQKLLQATAFRYSKGDISEYELKKIEVEGTRYENSIAVLEVEVRKKLNELKKALSLSQNDQLAIVDDLQPPDPAAVQAILQQEVKLEQRPDLLAVQKEIVIAERSLQVAEKENMPNFAAMALYHYEPGSAIFPQNHYFGLGISAPLRIFNRNQGVREAYAQTIEKKKLNYAHELLGAQAELAAQRNAIRQYLEVLSRSQERLATSKELYEKGRFLYAKKAANLIQLLESERSYFDAQREYFEIFYNFQESLEIYLAMSRTIKPEEMNIGAQ